MNFTQFFWFSFEWPLYIHRVRINYRRISSRHNLSSKCRKIMKFVSITHSECSIWNGPTVATAISWEKRKPALEGNGCLTFCTWPPPSPDPTVCDFFLRGFIKDNVYVPPLPKTLPELRERINTAIGNVTQDMLERVWREWEYRLDICHVTRGAHIECIWGHYETANIPLSNGSNIMHFCSVFVKIWVAKSSNNLYAPCRQITDEDQIYLLRN